MAHCLADAFGQLNVIGFAGYWKNRCAKADAEIESFAAHERLRGSLEHVQRPPAIRQALDIKRHNRSTCSACCHGCAGVPWPHHLLLKIAVCETRRENAEDWLLPPEGLRVLE